MTSLSSPIIQGSPSQEYFFQVKIICESNTLTQNLANYLKQELMRVKIDSIIYSYTSGLFEDKVIQKDFDIVLVELEWPSVDPDPSVYFSSGGAGNYWGIAPSISGGEANDELLSQALIEPDDEERQALYADWQQNLMNDILPVIPLYNTITTYCTWDTLSGWDHSLGLVESLPYMQWDSAHPGQSNTSIFNDYVFDWDSLNPLFTRDNSVSRLFAEPLIQIDAYGDPQPFLAKDWEYLNNHTTLRLYLRNDVKWHVDEDNLFPNEYFSADDVLFSIKMYKHLSTVGSFFQWVDSVTKINETTVELVIDGAPNTPGLQYYAPCITDLDQLILPEHYLNVSVDEETGLPDRTAGEWTKYADNGLGTGMYILDSYTEGTEASFRVNEDWWGKNASYINEDLDIQRYTYQIRSDLFSIENLRQEFEQGNIDVFKNYIKTLEEYTEPPYQAQSLSDRAIMVFGFNLQTTNTPELSDQELCEDGTISKGLAVRKAIAHLVDKQTCADLLEVPSQIIHTPFSNRFSEYISTNVTQYEHDIPTAKEYMMKAGFNPETLTSDSLTFLLAISSLLFLGIIVILRDSKKNS